MISKFILSKCLKPIYFQNTRVDAQECGMWNGVIISFIIVLLLCIYIFKKKLNINIHYIFMFSLLFIFTSGLVSYFTYGNFYDTYINFIKYLIDKEGYTRQQAISYISGIQAGEISLNPSVASLIFARNKEDEIKK